MNRACVPQEKHQNSQEWAKFMNFFVLALFFGFGLPGRLLKLITDRHFLGGTIFNLISNCRYRIALPEEFISIRETDLWEFQQEISHYRYRFSLEFL